jgi:GDP-L-fucose synthase
MRSSGLVEMAAISDFFRGRKVMVTGGAGLIGSAFVTALLEAGAMVFTVRHQRPIRAGNAIRTVDGDLRDRDICSAAARGMQCIVHAAGVSGGSKQVTVAGIPMFTDNLLMNTQMLEAARLEGVEHYLFVSNSSVYAKSEQPLREEHAWGESSVGIPENETGMVKRAGEIQCALYARFTEMRIAIVRAGNAYGSNDNFELDSSHVVPALIHKAVVGKPPFVLWGSGKTERDFIHSSDIARGGLFLLERAVPNQCEPINIATGKTVTIEELARLILELVGRGGEPIIYDPSAPPAAPAKRIHVGKMRALGFKPMLSLEEGLRQTIAWYRARIRGQTAAA